MTNAEFNEAIEDLFAQTKAGLLPRKERFKAIEALTDRYISENGERPEAGQLDRLATLSIYEEIVDSRKNKMREEETPVMSDSQYRRRTDGAHARGGAGSEVASAGAAGYSADGRYYGLPVRKTLLIKDAISMDTALSRNEERRRKYNEFTRVQPVHTWNMYE